MRVSAKVDYAVRASVELAAAGEGPVKSGEVAAAQHIPLQFLESILVAMRLAGLLRSQRGPDGGYWLARSPREIAIADVIRAVEGPLLTVTSEPAEALTYAGRARPLRDIWVAVHASLRSVLETVTLADVVNESLPDTVSALAHDPEAWIEH